MTTVQKYILSTLLCLDPNQQNCGCKFFQPLLLLIKKKMGLWGKECEVCWSKVLVQESIIRLDLFSRNLEILGHPIAFFY